jgi:conjugal transfer pilus assembly protein TraI
MGLFGRRKTASIPAPMGASAVSVDDPEIPRYPPFLRGLPVAAPARIVATQANLIAQLQDGLAFTDARFTVLVRPVVERYAAFVHLLPASESHHHRGAGGPVPPWAGGRLPRRAGKPGPHLRPGSQPR